MVDILMLILASTKLQALASHLGMIALTAGISTLSGLWGVLVTDMFQFVIKMSMVIALAVFAVQAVGGIDQMKVKLLAIDATRGNQGSVSVSSRPRLRLDADDHLLCLYFTGTGGPPGIPEPNPAVEAISRSACSAPRTKRTPCSLRCGSTSRHYAVRPWPGFLSR